MDTVGKGESVMNWEIRIDIYIYIYSMWYNSLWASLVAQMVKHLPAMLEIQVRFLGWEDSLEKEIATHSSTLTWKIPCMEEPGRLQSMGLQKVRHDGVISLKSL